MIQLTRLNGSQVFINAVLVEQIEATPDTVVTLTTGKRLIVAESPAEVIERAVGYLGQLRQAAGEEEGRGVTPAQWGRLIR